MAMTEKQGGTDLRQTQTVAERDGAMWRIVGHKWFFSVPHSDAFITLARTERGRVVLLDRRAGCPTAAGTTS
jgi:putative acyl-CoA dehydrogenase